MGAWTSRPQSEPVPLSGSVPREAGWALSMIAMAAAASLALRPHIASTNLAMIYLLAVVATAMR